MSGNSAFRWLSINEDDLLLLIVECAVAVQLHGTSFIGSLTRPAEQCDRNETKFLGTVNG